MIDISPYSVIISWRQLLEISGVHHIFPLQIIQEKGAETTMIVTPEDMQILESYFGKDHNMTELRTLLDQVDEQAKRQPGSPAGIDLPRGLQVKVNYNIDGRFGLQLMRENIWPSSEELATVIKHYPGLSGQDPELVKQFERPQKGKTLRFIQAWFAQYPNKAGSQLPLTI